MSRFRSRGPRLVRKGTLWVPTIFSTPLDQSGAVPVELILADYADYGMPAGAAQFGGKVRRVLGDLDVTITPLGTAFAILPVSINWAVYVLDNEDTDNSIVTTAAGGILQTCRVIQTGHLGCTVQESTGDGNAFRFIMPSLKIKFDVRTQIKLKPDDLLICGIQYVTTAVGTVLASEVSGITRVLMDRP